MRYMHITRTDYNGPKVARSCTVVPPQKFKTMASPLDVLNEDAAQTVV